jgi:hypothetical protein
MKGKDVTSQQGRNIAEYSSVEYVTGLPVLICWLIETSPTEMGVDSNHESITN